MGKMIGRMAALGSLVTVGVLFGATAAHAVKINVGNGATAISVTLQIETASVAGTQNDITYSGATISNSKKCLRTNATTCTADADCPLADPLNATSAHEPCVVTPNCAVNAAIGKEGFFSFLKSAGCTGTACDCTPGTDCTALRAIIMSLNIVKPTAIADNATLYTCTFNAPSAAVTLVNSNQGAGDPDGNALASVGGANGTLGGGGIICIGDCNNLGDVSPGELLTGLDILLGNADLSACDHWGPPGTDVTPGRLLTGLDNLLLGCP